MTRITVCAPALSWVLVAVFANVVLGNGSGPAVTQPVGDDATLVYEVWKVQGNVRISKSGTDPKATEGWRSLKVGDIVKAGEQLHAGIRSKAKLVARPAEPPTVMVVENGLVNFADLAMKEGVARNRIELAYGSIRAGVAEGETRSDMEIHAPAATLSKKGTDIFGIEARPDGRFNMFLTERGRGLIQAIQTRSTDAGALNTLRSRTVTPGQWVTYQMARAIDNVQFDRNVDLTDPFGVQGIDQLFALINNRGGFGFLLAPGGGSAGLLNASVRTSQDGQGGLVDDGQTPGTQGVVPVRSQQIGDFGIGQGGIPGIFGPARLIGRNEPHPMTPGFERKLPRMQQAAGVHR